MKYYYVYILKSQRDGTYYIGYTEDLNRRMEEHNSEGNSYTNRKAPWDLVYFEGYTTKRSALAREKKLKTSSWHKKQLIERIRENER